MDDGPANATFRHSETDGEPVLHVDGEIDVANAGLFRRELDAALARSSGAISVDFSGVGFIDSSGIGVLVGVLKAAQARGGSVTILDPTASSRRLFEITGLTEEFGLA
ncbi:MAG TPA: STAS domain-containing protein [Acidimicrobiia bacterium]|jgi:anti-sigma B factor antagonist